MNRTIGVWLPLVDDPASFECSECGAIIYDAAPTSERPTRWHVGQPCEYCIEDSGGDRVLP